MALLISFCKLSHAYLAVVTWFPLVTRIPTEWGAAITADMDAGSWMNSLPPAFFTALVQKLQCFPLETGDWHA